MTKLAVAIVHGVGKQDEHFADGISKELTERFIKLTKGRASESDLVIEPVYWAPAIQQKEDKLWKKVKAGGELDFVKLRRFMIDFAGDAIAYQPTPSDRQIYDGIHTIFAEALNRLADRAGANAPLLVIAHSLGTVISSNYFYDLHQQLHTGSLKAYIGSSVMEKLGDTPLERGETFSHFYTLGSPIAIWGLRYDNPLFGRPISVPSPRLKDHYPDLAGGWFNFYDEDDIIGYPLKTLNDEYKKAVKKDIMVNAGGLLSSWTPASHTEYWTDNDVTIPIARELAKAWEILN